MTERTHEQKLAILRDFGDLQAECAQKTRFYRAKDKPELWMRFERASLQAMNARLSIQAALMAERESNVG
jgi:hypothetical protein